MKGSLLSALVTLNEQPREFAVGGPLASSDAFLRRVAAWRAGIEGSKARSVAVFIEERTEFAAAFFGALLARVEVVLPGDTLAPTVAALEARCDGFVGRFPQTIQPVEGAPGGFLELSPDSQVTVFTSGTTGAPSAISKALRQLACEVDSLEQTFSQGEVTVHSTVSHQHIYGLLFTVLWPVASRARLSNTRLEYPEQLETALTSGPGVLVTSPAHLKRLRDDVQWSLPSLKAVFSSGGPLSEDGAHRSRQTLGLPATEVFGSSETGGIAWRVRVQGPMPAWTPLPQVQWRVGPYGTLEVRSPHLSDDDWFTSADVAVDAGEGRFVLYGRADRIAKVEEKRVSLTAIEKRLLATGLVTDVRAVVIEGGRVVVGVVAVPTAEGRAVLQKGKKALVDVLKAQLQDTVERVALPRRFRFVDELPVNEQGKTTDAAVTNVLSPLVPQATWVERSPTRASLTFEVDPSLRVLEGHFVEAAIVPGVAQLDWAITWAGEVFGCGDKTQRLDAIKFQALVLPGQQLRVDLEWNAEKSTLTFRYLRGATPCSSGRVVLSH